MTSNILSEVMQSLFATVSVISVLLLIGMILRSKFIILQKLFLPASVIGGFVGLLLGPIILKDYAILPFPKDWLKIASLLPGFLIVPVIASIPLGVALNTKKRKGTKENATIIDMFLVLIIISTIQNFFGYSVASIFRNRFDLYPTFGTELSSGFFGGHGTAGMVGNILKSAGQPYWETAQGITTTVATVGLISGILIGILLINIASRKGHTVFIKDTENMPNELVTGIEKDVSKQKSSGKEPTHSSAIDSLTFHLALIMMVSGASYGVLSLFKKYNILLLNSIPEWVYAMVLMYGVWSMMIKFNLEWMVDSKTKMKITSALTEFAVVAAIMSLPVETVFTYITPLLILLIGGLILTVLASYFLSKWAFDDFWFERSLTVLGMNTGVFMTGLLLLKMVDPDFESPVLKDYSISYSFGSMVGFIMIPLTFNFLVSHRFLEAGLVYGGLLLGYGVALIFRVVSKKENLAVLSREHRD